MPKGHRLAVEFSAKDIRCLDRIIELSGATTYAGAMRTSLFLLEYVQQQLAEGWELRIKKGNEEIYLALPGFSASPKSVGKSDPVPPEALPSNVLRSRFGSSTEMVELVLSRGDFSALEITIKAMGTTRDQLVFPSLDLYNTIIEHYQTNPHLQFLFVHSLGEQQVDFPTDTLLGRYVRELQGCAVLPPLLPPPEHDPLEKTVDPRGNCRSHFNLRGLAYERFQKIKATLQVSDSATLLRETLNYYQYLFGQLTADPSTKIVLVDGEIKREIDFSKTRLGKYAARLQAEKQLYLLE